jgi:hypothetical protein
MSSNDFIIKECYFCDYPKKVPSNIDENCDYHGVNMFKYKDLWICFCCSKTQGLHNMDFSIQENGECCICFEEKILLSLPTCIHKLCIQCCKTIYFGYTTNKPPTVSYNDIEYPEWPYEFYCSNEEEFKGTRRDWMIVDDKELEYSGFRDEYLHYKNKSYDELVVIRDNLMFERPEWMNTEEFINYENSLFLYEIEFREINKKWKEFNKTKVKGNGLCPICREQPFLYHRYN